MFINISRVGVRRMGSDSLQWSPATGQGAMDTNWSIESSVWIWRRTSLQLGRRSTGTGCPGRLWSLPLWRYSRPAWTRSYAACCRWPCFVREVGLDGPQRCLPTPTILWRSLKVSKRRFGRESHIMLYACMWETYTSSRVWIHFLIEAT